jgi:hypothetical protein
MNEHEKTSFPSMGRPDILLNRFNCKLETGVGATLRHLGLEEPTARMNLHSSRSQEAFLEHRIGRIAGKE